MVPGGLKLSPRALLAEEAALAMLAAFADVERRDRPMGAHYARPDFTALALVVVERDRVEQVLRIGHRVHRSFLLFFLIPDS
jgi:hypothetical protein